MAQKKGSSLERRNFGSIELNDGADSEVVSWKSVKITFFNSKANFFRNVNVSKSERVLFGYWTGFKRS